MAEPIPKVELERAHRKLSRRVASCIVRAMAETDTSISDIAARLGRDENRVLAKLVEFIMGDGGSLDWISDMLLACGCEADWSVQKITPEPEASTLSERGK